jgi:uncharacterized protein
MLLPVVLPALEDEFEAVAIGIAKLHGVVAGIVVVLGSGRMDLLGPGGEGCSIGRVHVGLRVSDEAHMNHPWRWGALPEPEEHPTLRPEALEVGVARRAVLAVVIVAHRDTDLGQHRLVEGDGAGKVADGQKNVVKHACPCPRQQPRPISTGWVSTHALAGEVWSPITWIDVLGFAVPAKRLAPRRDPVFDATMLIGIISDTHGLLRPEALEALAEVKHIIHAGDIGSPEIVPRLEEIAPVTAIRGNVDTQGWASEFPPWTVVTLADRTIYVIHDRGDLDLDPVAAGVDVVVSGHSHRPKIETIDGVLYLNPGSAGPRRFHLPTTVAIVDLSPSAIRPEIHDLVEQAAPDVT